MSKNDIIPEIQEPGESTAIDLLDGKKTPISNKDIVEVDSAKWPEMTLSELYEQKLVLESRLYACYQYKPTMAPLIQKGLNEIQTLIDKKNNDEGRLI